MHLRFIRGDIQSHWSIRQPTDCFTPADWINTLMYCRNVVQICIWRQTWRLCRAKCSSGLPETHLVVHGGRIACGELHVYSYINPLLKNRQYSDDILVLLIVSLPSEIGPRSLFNHQISYDESWSMFSRRLYFSSVHEWHECICTSEQSRA